MENLVEFEIVIQQLLSPDNEIRQLAEKSLEQIDIHQRVKYLFLMAKTAVFNVEERQLCLVLLRRLLCSEWEGLWKKWSSTDRTTFTSELLMACQSEPNELLRKRFCDLVAEILRSCSDDHDKLMGDEAKLTWEQILNFVFSCSKSETPHLKEIALNIFESVPGIFGEEQHKYVDVCKGMLLSGLQSPMPLNVKISAVKAASSFLCFNEGEKSLLKHFQPLLPEILKVAVEAAESEQSDMPLECLSDMAGSIPKVYRSYLQDVCSVCLKIVSDTDKEDALRHSALEILITLSESAGPMMRKDGATFIPDIIQQCLGLMVEIEDTDDWNDLDEYEDEDLDSNASVGETFLDRLACSLGGKSVLQPVLRFVQPMMHHENWKHRYAGLMALSSIGEGCRQQMEQVLDAVLSGVVEYLSDPHPRVRFAACNALGQMSTDFAPTLQKKYAEKVVPPLLAALDNLDSPRVAANAAAALVNFSEDAPKGVVLTHLERFMSKFQTVLQESMKMMVEKKRKIVLEQIVTTIASVADTAEEGFAPFYDGVMPCLKYILGHFDGPNLKLLRGKTFECVSLIGLAVGKEKFLRDANEIMQLLLKTQTELGDIEADDPQRMDTYLPFNGTGFSTVFASICISVMPAVMKTASFKPEVTILESEDTQHLETDDDWEFVKLGDQSFGIKTAGLEDKATACEMLVCYARELKGAFADYVEEVTKLMVPLLKFYFHDGVRSAATESLPHLLEAAKSKGAHFVAEMWKYIFPELLKAVEMDPEDEVLAEHMYSLARCIECLGVGCLGDQEMRQVVEVMDEKFKKHFEKTCERENLRKDEDYDEEVEHDLTAAHEDDAVLLCKISDIFHALFSTYRENMLPYFDALLPHFIRLLDSKMPVPERQWGICFYDDAIEFGGAGAVKYLANFLEPMLRALTDSAPELRQAAATFMLKRVPFHSDFLEAIPLLVKMIMEPQARANDATTAATENATAAVAKILKYNGSMVDANQLVPAFISWLPIWEDNEELPHVYDYFCELIESNYPLVVGEHHANLPHLVKVMAQTFVRNKMNDNDELVRVARRMCNIVRQVQSNAQVSSACSSILSPEECEALQEMVNKC